MILSDWYEQEYPEHARTSCSDEHPINAEVNGHGCWRCNAILFTHYDELVEEVKQLRKQLLDRQAQQDADKVNAQPHYVIRFDEEINGLPSDVYGLVRVDEWNNGLSRAVANLINYEDGDPIVVYAAPAQSDPAMEGNKAVFAIGVLGNPMREYASGKWETAVWPSDLPAQPAIGEAAKYGWDARHIKTRNIYRVIGEATNATNAQDGQGMVIYRRDGKTYVREAAEFQDKFEATQREKP